MDAELKRKWVEALRSGEYEQGRLKLNSHGRYCCLGVLCDVAGLKWLRCSELGFIPAGDHIHQHLVRFGIANESSDLVDMNDNQGKTFAEIADYIEANL